MIIMIRKSRFLIIFFLTIASAIQSLSVQKTITENPFVIIILTYNNEAYCIKNLESALEQKYNNFRVLIINDCSTDKTEKRISEVIKNHPKKHLATYIKNSYRRGVMANHIKAISHCQDHEIAIHLDGDDFFAHSHVLERINQEYNKGAWLTWGSYKDMSTQKRGEFSQALPASIYEKNSIRRYKWATSHPRSFYVWLFKKIKNQDLQYGNKYIECPVDFAFMIPMIEMAGKRAHYIPDILYHYNDLSPLNIFKTSYRLCVETETHLRSRTRYTRLK